MNIGLWSDCHNFPSLPLMKLSAYHKQQGDHVELLNYMNNYDLVYASKVFSFTPDIEEYAVVRGCPRGCDFCVVAKKEGRCSRKVADLSEFYRGEQKEIKLLDPNILASKEHEELLKQLINANAWVDFTQGLDVRLLSRDNITLLNRIKTKSVHFAWDNPKQDLTSYFQLFSKHSTFKRDGKRIVYVLTNFNSTIDEDLYRIYTLRDLGYTPYVMIYQKESADRTHRYLQRWVNNKRIFRTIDRFEEYDPREHIKKPVQAQLTLF